MKVGSLALLGNKPGLTWSTIGSVFFFSPSSPPSSKLGFLPTTLFGGPVEVPMSVPVPTTGWHKDFSSIAGFLCSKD